jgi:hypothetical protein
MPPPLRQERSNHSRRLHRYGIQIPVKERQRWLPPVPDEQLNPLEAPALGTVEAFTVAQAQTAPDPYVGNGTYQTPDIILLDSSNTPVPIGGAHSGAWDTLLLPNTYYGIQAVIYNDSTVAAANTVVRFWHFPGGVGTAGAQIDKQTVTVPSSDSVVVVLGEPVSKWRRRPS